MSDLSQLFMDRPQHPMDTAMYWMEYVIKYKGARHLRSPALDLMWYQYLLLDVIAFMIISLVIGFYLCKYLLKRLVKSFPVPIEKQQDNNNTICYKNSEARQTNTDGYEYPKINTYCNTGYQKGCSNLNLENLITTIEHLYDQNHKKWE